MRGNLFYILFAWLNVFSLVATWADDRGEPNILSGPDRAFFENRIRPVLEQHCLECHQVGSEKLGGNLLLDSAARLRKGGDSGPAIKPGNPDESLLIQALEYREFEMPPDRQLPRNVVNDFREWIRRGSPDPRTKKPDPSNAKPLDRDSLWSFQPRGRPIPPQTNNRSWAETPIDRFVLHQLEVNRIKPTGDAPPRTLLRRLYFDLIGLPPTAEDYRSFAEAYRLDPDRAWSETVDRLLASSQFGIRFGQHWLDVARYGESNGDDGLGRNASFPHAWRYRDYVVQALNDDTPYDRFLTEQIAGDLLPARTAKQRNRQLIATGFLALGSKPAAAMNNNFSMDIVNDQINVVSTGIMGLSVACARCHDHKHDPIPTRDYYALAGIFSSTETLYGLAANEKLTAPPTPLHSLRSDLPTPGKKRTEPPHFPQIYPAAIRSLKPLSFAELRQRPEDLTVDGKVTFSETAYAQLTPPAGLRGQHGKTTGDYSVAFWFRNDTPNQARPITAYLFSRAKFGDSRLLGDHLGIGGKHDAMTTGRLFVFNGNVDNQKIIGGTTRIEPQTWNHVVMIRQSDRVQVHLNGNLELDGQIPDTHGDSTEFCFGERSDRFAPLVGNLAHVTFFDRAISADQAGELHRESGQPRGVKTLGVAMGVRDRAKPVDVKIQINGLKSKPGPLVPRGFLTAYRNRKIIPDLPPAKLRPEPPGPPDPAHAQSGETSLVLAGGQATGSGSWPGLPRFDGSDKTSGRLQLANWLTDPEHPHTARVIVNRIWLKLMGRGIVDTVDDFGVYGARPSHPQLLDYLANRLIEHQWSLKQLIREIVLSRTYRLDSRTDPAFLAIDPDNRWLGRHSRRRLDAEQLRDAILQASGALDTNLSSGSAIESIDQLINWPIGEATNLHREDFHRSIYLCRLRHAPPTELAAFDLPDGVEVTGNRQSRMRADHLLFLMNNSIVVNQSRTLAARVIRETEDPAAAVSLVFERILGRRPSTAESRAAMELVNRSTTLAADGSPGGPSSRIAAWSNLCQALFMSNEFLFTD